MFAIFMVVLLQGGTSKVVSVYDGYTYSTFEACQNDREKYVDTLNMVYFCGSSNIYKITRKH